jgi:hypothetical protein
MGVWEPITPLRSAERTRLGTQFRVHPYKARGNDWRVCGVGKKQCHVIPRGAVMILRLQMLSTVFNSSSCSSHFYTRRLSDGRLNIRTVLSATSAGKRTSTDGMRIGCRIQ